MKRVFVTEHSYEPDFVSLARGEDGARSADIICQHAAEDAGLDGRWKAWISTDQANAIDRIQGTGPFVRLDGVLVFPDHASLTSPPLDRLNVDENGYAHGCDDEVWGHLWVWTGTRTDGRWDLDDCYAWTETMEGVGGTTGDVCRPDEWTDSEVGHCEGENHLLCFEQ